MIVITVKGEIYNNKTFTFSVYDDDPRPLQNDDPPIPPHNPGHFNEYVCKIYEIIQRPRGASNKELVEPGRELFDMLLPDRIKKVLTIANTETRVVFKTSLALQNIPWEVLFDKESNSFLGIKFALYRQIVSTQSDASAPCFIDNRSILSLAGDKFSKVNDVIQKVNDTLVHKPKLDVINASDIDRKFFLDAFSKYEVINYFGHSEWNGDNTNSGLNFKDGDLFSLHEIKTAAEQDGSSKRPRLVFLNSCESGTLGERLGGIAGAFLSLGVGSFIGCSIKVWDKYAHGMSEHFYTCFLRHGKSPSEALRQARKAMYDKGTSWALYRLFGDAKAMVFGQTAENAPRHPVSHTAAPIFDIAAFHKHCNEQTRKKIEEKKKHGQYDTKTYTERAGVEDSLEKFLAAKGTPSGVKIITGRAGAGKTSLLCRLAETMLKKEKSGKEAYTVIFISSDDISHIPSETPIWDAIKKFTGDFNQFVTKFEDFNKNLDKSKSRLLIFVDSLDQIPANIRDKSFNEIKEFIRLEKNQELAVKIIFSCRDYDLPQELKKQKNLYDLPMSQNTNASEVGISLKPDEEKDKTVFPLPDFPEAEAIELFNKNARKKNVKPEKLWENLSKGIRDVFKTSPLLVRIFFEIFDPKGKKAALNIAYENALLERYLEKKIPNKEFFLNRVMQKCFEYKTLVISPDVYKAIIEPDEGDEALEDSRKANNKNFKKLLSANILKQDSKNGKIIREFQHQAIGEHALVQFFKNSYPLDLSFFKSQLADIEKFNGLDTALSLLLAEMWGKDDLHVWEKAIIDNDFQPAPYTPTDGSNYKLGPGLHCEHGPGYKLLVKSFLLQTMENIEDNFMKKWNNLLMTAENNIEFTCLFRLGADINNIAEDIGGYNFYVDKYNIMMISEHVNRNLDKLSFDTIYAYILIWSHFRYFKKPSRYYKYLKKSLLKMKKFAEDEQGNIRYQYITVLTYHRLAGICRNRLETIKYLEEELKIHNILADAKPENIIYQWHLKCAYAHLSAIYWIDDGYIGYVSEEEQYLNCFIGGIAVNQRYKYWLANSFILLSRYYYKFCYNSKAIKACKEALKILKSLSKTEPVNLEYQNSLAFSFTHLAEIQAETKNFSLAQKNITSALNIREMYKTYETSSILHAVKTAATYSVQAIIFQKRGNLEAENKWLIKELAILEKVVSFFSGGKKFKKELYDCYWCLIENLTSQGREDDARKYLIKKTELEKEVLE